MALIEGVGDEVTLLFATLLVLTVLLLAWISTRTSEPPEHLFAGPAPSQRTEHSHQDTAPSSTTTTPLSSSSYPLSSPSTFSMASSSPSSVGDSFLTEAPPPPEDEQVGGDGVRSRGGEGVASQRNMVVRLKFLNDTERTAQVKPQDTIGYIKRTYFAGQEHQVRLIYQGQLLQDDARTLASLNLAHNCVLHCHISQHAARAAAGGPRPADQVRVALNVGSLMVPLLVLMLSVLWYCQIQYRQFFTAPATASLVGVTILLSLVAFGVYRR
ncbi:transmembrane and ubiquitin-like domain-containing protein 1 [Archocentrus centrarchus]|uniref:transmembrane and ubiquitin-like domain-containing protein 1 n=1 Tax=Archocentrus centrarchus TaxID=63155 RepID=UPI0011E9D62C|nr:transmembrane and ubiquitin-like domain-containing protein 1 [Archocentrus centrarchus]XP_030607693.1 transmembrane and ubiquitin-like domain-containing protein 1 [Archocentrus centrarchus]XP_030607694.1 transmembrane and ubiquitin-like domain-containing protein 1 [Archocentrus centrarchus]XP_030607695.1 transmembrane and ubiquitin-like domain-containing protein 1 [Archocentrus centrarchus]XP_030607696.1 transmembrane and ubiquitin-like domain-containing protein 1 [Archocentrus centrarchus]